MQIWLCLLNPCIACGKYIDAITIPSPSWWLCNIQQCTSAFFKATSPWLMAGNSLTHAPLVVVAFFVQQGALSLQEGFEITQHLLLFEKQHLTLSLDQMDHSKLFSKAIIRLNAWLIGYHYIEIRIKLPMHGWQSSIACFKVMITCQKIEDIMFHT